MNGAGRAAAASAGLALDGLFGDPPDRWHPVAWFGLAMQRREAKAWRDDRASGMLHAVIGTVAAAAAARAAGSAGRRLGGASGEAVVAALVTATVIGARSLDRLAGEIGDALAEGRLDDARRLLPGLVGRDPDRLDEAGIARAVVESVAENTVDAVVAPLLWAAAAGPVGAAAYRAINTLDAMVGYRNERYRRFGWASARLDDAANYLPARASAVAVAVLAPARAAAVGRAVRTQAPAHPSPNAGVVEAAFAAALGLRLGGINQYDGVLEHRPDLGFGADATPLDIARARALARRVALVVAVSTVAAPALARLAVPRGVWRR